MAPHIAWLGLGNMGRGMCKNLVEKGDLTHPIIIYNRTVERSHDLAARIGHATVSTSVADAAAQADILFYCLGDDDAVMSALQEIVQTEIKGKTLVD